MFCLRNEVYGRWPDPQMSERWYTPDTKADEKDPHQWWHHFSCHVKDHGSPGSFEKLPESDREALKKILQQIGTCNKEEKETEKERVEVFFIKSGNYYYLSHSKDALATREFELKAHVYETFVKPHFIAFLTNLAIDNPRLYEETVSVRDTGYSEKAAPFETEVISLSFEKKTK